MKRLTRAVPLFALAAFLTACEAPAPTQLDDAVVEIGKGNTPAVSGSAHILVGQDGDQRRQLTFHANVGLDGTVKGKFHLEYAGDAAIKTHGDITCVTVVGNTAYIGAVATKSHDPARVGGETGWVVQDNGKGGKDDLISLMWVPNFDPNFGADATCSTNTSLFPFFPLYGGNVTVR